MATGLSPMDHYPKSTGLRTGRRIIFGRLLPEWCQLIKPLPEFVFGSIDGLLWMAGSIGGCRGHERLFGILGRRGQSSRIMAVHGLAVDALAGPPGKFFVPSLDFPRHGRSHRGRYGTGISVAIKG